MLVIPESGVSTDTTDNAYFTRPGELAPVTKARAVDINNLALAVDAAFDKLPPEMALKTGTVTYGVDTGNVANAYAITLPVPLTGYIDGMDVTLRPARNNTGACSLNVNNLGAIAIKRTDGTDLQVGDVVINTPVRCSYSQAANAFVIANVVTSQMNGLQAAVTSATGSATAAVAAAGAASASAGAAAGSATAAQASAQAAATTAANLTSSQVQADWAVSDTASKAYILNKTSILSMLLAGLSTASGAAVTVADTILSAFGKLQRQITDNVTAIGSKVSLGSVNPSYGTTLTNGLPPGISTISSSNNDGNVPLIIGNGANNFASAVIQFVRNGLYSGFFGLDTDNKLKWGSGSMGAVAYEIYHQGNLSPADTRGAIFSGVITMNNGIGIYAKDAGGTQRQLISLASDNNIYQYVAGSNFIRWFNGAGTTELAQLSNTGDFWALTVKQTSDETKKENWRAPSPTLVDDYAALEKVGIFDWIATGKADCGPGAQSLESIFPEAVSTVGNTKVINAGGAALVIIHQLTRRMLAAEAEIKLLKGE